LICRIFRPEIDEVTREWGKVHEELNNLYFSHNIHGMAIKFLE